MVKIMNRNKSGYSLLEACVVMVVAAIFVALVANVIPHKVKSKVQSQSGKHGSFVCYYDGSTLKYIVTENGTSGGSNTASASEGCKFTTPAYAEYLIINAVGGGEGGSSDSVGSAGEFQSSFWVSLDDYYTIKPGLGGAAGADGEDTVICSGDTCDDDSELISASGGKTPTGLEDTTTEDILSCEIVDPYYTCDGTPSCEVINEFVQVKFCRTDEEDDDSFKTVNLTYKKTDDDGNVILNNPRYIVNDLYTEQVKVGNRYYWKYYDISLFSDFNNYDTNPVYISGWTPENSYYPSLYTIKLEIGTNPKADNENESNFGRLAKNFGYSGAILNAGNGGTTNSAGYPGAVIFMW